MQAVTINVVGPLVDGMALLERAKAVLLDRLVEPADGPCGMDQLGFALVEHIDGNRYVFEHAGRADLLRACLAAAGEQGVRAAVVTSITLLSFGEPAEAPQTGLFVCFHLCEHRNVHAVRCAELLAVGAGVVLGDAIDVKPGSLFPAPHAIQGLPGLKQAH